MSNSWALHKNWAELCRLGWDLALFLDLFLGDQERSLLDELYLYLERLEDRDLEGLLDIETDEGIELMVFDYVCNFRIALLESHKPALNWKTDSFQIEILIDVISKRIC